MTYAVTQPGSEQTEVAAREAAELERTRLENHAKLMGVLLICGVAAAYFLPTIVACLRGKSNSFAIFALNLLTAGHSLVGSWRLFGRLQDLRAEMQEMIDKNRSYSQRPVVKQVPGRVVDPRRLPPN